MKKNLLEQTNLTIVDIGSAGGMHDRWSHLKTSNFLSGTDRTLGN